MAGTMKEIAENNEKLHRLQMINMILRNMSSYVDDVVSRLEDEFDDCEDFEDYVTESIIKNTRENIETLSKYINEPQKPFAELLKNTR
jgi:predicted nuclease with TOPRIM domain